MKTKNQTKEFDHFKKDFLKKSDCVVGGTDGDGPIDRDKASRIPPQGR